MSYCGGRGHPSLRLNVEVSSSFYLFYVPSDRLNFGVVYALFRTPCVLDRYLFDADAASMRCTTVAQRHRGDVIVTSSRPLHAPAAEARRPNSLVDLDLSVSRYRLTSSDSSRQQPSLVLALPCLVFVISRFRCNQPRSMRETRLKIR